MGGGAFTLTGVDAPATDKPFVPATGLPITSFNFKQISPPSPIYVTDTHRLVFTAMSTIAGEQITIGIWRFDATQGILVPQVETFTLPTARTSVIKNFQMAEGFLSTIKIVASLATQPGQTFVSVTLNAGIGGGVKGAMTLLASYLTFLVPTGWPGASIRLPTEGPGNRRDITGTTPAAGAEISETVPAFARWRLISLAFTFTTAVAVANRQVRLFMDDGVTPFFRGVAGPVQAASLTDFYSGVPGATGQNDALGNVILTLPPDVRLVTADRIRTNTNLIQGADQYLSVQYIVEEWIDLF